MQNKFFVTFLLIVIVNFIRCQVFFYQPEQIHLSYGNTVDDIVVTWSTFNDTNETLVEYGINGYVLIASGNSTLFIDGGTEQHSQYIHRVTLPNLTPGSKYGKYISF